MTRVSLARRENRRVSSSGSGLGEHCLEHERERGEGAGETRANRFGKHQQQREGKAQDGIEDKINNRGEAFITRIRNKQYLIRVA